MPTNCRACGSYATWKKSVSVERELDAARILAESVHPSPDVEDCDDDESEDVPADVLVARLRAVLLTVLPRLSPAELNRAQAILGSYPEE